MLKLPYQISQVENDSVPLVIQPGFVSILADRDAQGRWKDGSLVRFANSSGLPQILGGWVDVTPANIFAGQGIKGSLRSFHEWQSLDRQFWLVMGTNCKLILYNQGIGYDITPTRRTAALTNPFTTVNGSNIVQVTDNLHGAFVGDNVQFAGSTTFNNVTISGEYTVLSVSINSYTIQAATTANATGSGGGHPTATYDINAMPVSQTSLLGWSASTWGTPRAPANFVGSISATTLTVTQILNGVIGSNGTNVLSGTGVTTGTTITAQLTGPTGGIGTYTVSVSQNVSSENMTLTQGWGQPASSSNIIAPVGMWSLDNWGEDLIASPRGGAIYVWKKSTGPFARAQLMPNAPVANGRVIVAQDARQIIAFGSSSSDANLNPTGPLDPSLIRFCNTEDYTTWIASPTNNAGSYRLSAGSGIVTVTKTRGGYYVGSTKAASLLYPTGDANVYGSNALGQSSRPCGPQASADFNGTTYIMAQDNFQVFDGVLNTMACEVWNAIFDQQLSTSLNRARMEQVSCHINRGFSEVWWNYPSIGGTGENDRYVVYNWVLKCWHYGSWAANAGGDINRSGGHDWGDVFNAPYMGFFNAALAVTPNLNGWSRLMQHETGQMANGSSTFGEFIESWDFDILNSGELCSVSHLLPAMKEFTGVSTTLPPTIPTLNIQRSNLLHFDDGANTFTDNGQTPLAWTASAGGSDALPAESGALAKFGIGSLFVGTGTSTGTFISTPANTGLDLNNADFTLDVWTYITAIPANKTQCIFDCSDSANSSGFAVVINSNGQIGVMGYGNGANCMTGQAGTFTGVVVTTGAWKHLVVQRKGSIITVGYNGLVQNKVPTQVGGVLTTTTGPLRVGGISTAMATNNAQITAANGIPVQGYLDEFSIVYGAGSYGPFGTIGSAYTVPSAPFTTPYTLPAYTLQTMLHFDDGQASTLFTDSAFVPLTWTANGGAIESTAQSKFGPGSLSSTGIGTKITTPNNANGPFDQTALSNDWTLDFWLYVPALPASSVTNIVDFSDGNTTMFQIALPTTGLLRVQPQGWSFPLGNPVFGNVTTNAWHHVALVVSQKETQGGGQFSLWRTYLDGIGGAQAYTTAASMPSLPVSNGLASIGQSAGTAMAQCFIDEFRFTQGVDIWTAGSFTPPTGPTGSSTVSFLSSLAVTVKTRKYQADAYKVKGPYSLLSTTQKISARAKARQMALRIGPVTPVPSNIGIVWTMGLWRAKLGEDGDR